ncbi:MAG: hypothetical protein ACXW3O_14380 [Brevundimonas sp.]
MEDVEGSGGRAGLLEAVSGRALGKGGLIALLALAACSTPASDASAPRAIEEAQLNQPVGSRVTDPTADLCRAGELQWLVGKPKTEIPVPVDVVNRRVACTTCPVTEDYSPHRLNIFFNEQSGIVEQVRCG